MQLEFQGGLFNPRFGGLSVYAHPPVRSPVRPGTMTKTALALSIRRAAQSILLINSQFRPNIGIHVIHQLLLLLTESLDWMSIFSHHSERSLEVVVNFMDIFVEFPVMHQSVNPIMPCVFDDGTHQYLSSKCMGTHMR